ncbi:hypothetical protein Pcinc_010230 [Petrolisthes cinctipes]|uniref:Uncharacterized protein n=1 Tax=Petrolisthes cinctipes TaxID=88211 RepID=A0AAE1KUQ0_PETCI|nr:hypothetical protein Pcinc_010230 [Petrolisthes cinctipes]
MGRRHMATVMWCRRRQIGVMRQPRYIMRCHAAIVPRPKGKSIFEKGPGRRQMTCRRGSVAPMVGTPTWQRRSHHDVTGVTSDENTTGECICPASSTSRGTTYHRKRIIGHQTHTCIITEHGGDNASNDEDTTPSMATKPG